MDIKRNIFKRKRIWAGILLAQFLLFYLVSKIPFAVDFFEGFFEFQKTAHQKIFAPVPFSLGDVLYIILIGTFIFFIIKILNKKNRNTYLVRTLSLLNVLYFTYQIFWGTLYFQKPVLDLLPKDEITVEETKHLALKYLKLCQQTRNQVNEDRHGVFMVSDLEEIKSEILRNQHILPAFINNKKGIDVNSLKPSVFKGVMSFSGILGYYNPFTAEAQYNPDLPATFLPFTLAHESAHQMGYAREQEANFVGYLIGNESRNVSSRYSTQYFVLKSLLNALSEKHPDFVKNVLAHYSPAMKRDRRAEKMFMEAHQGLLDSFFGFTNDLFLKSNRQEGSITYSYFVDLLIRYERISNELQ